MLAALLLISGCSKNVENDADKKTELSQAVSSDEKKPEEKVESAEEKEQTPEETVNPENSEFPESPTPEEQENTEEQTQIPEDGSPSPEENNTNKVPSSENVTKPSHTEKPQAQKPVQSTPKPQQQKPVQTTPKPEKPAPNTPVPNTPAPQKQTPEDVMKKILTGVDTPNYELTPIDASNFDYYMFTDYIDGAKGVSADALISSTAHSVCLVQLPEGTNASQVASQVKQNADPAKWICVEAESVEVATKDDMVLLVMSDSNTTSQIINNFNNN